MCLDCVIDHEAQLKKEGKFDEYQLSIIRQGARVHIKEMEDVLLELLMEQSNDSFVTEDGDIETWKGKDGGKQQLIQEIQEYIQKLKDAVGSQYL
jgi:flagellar basal body-associated protein FliL